MSRVFFYILILSFILCSTKPKTDKKITKAAKASIETKPSITINSTKTHKTTKADKKPTETTEKTETTKSDKKPIETSTEKTKTTKTDKKPIEITKATKSSTTTEKTKTTKKDIKPTDITETTKSKKSITTKTEKTPDTTKLTKSAKSSNTTEPIINTKLTNSTKPTKPTPKIPTPIHPHPHTIIHEPNPILNMTTKNIASLKLHTKLLQTVYSDSFSKNYYYTSLYIGSNKVKQTYMIDTGSSIMASPCSPCPDCGVHKNPFYFDLARKHKPLKCSSSICKLTPATSCTQKLKLIGQNSCAFTIKRAGGEGIGGYYIRDIVYMETDFRRNHSLFPKKIFRSYALPIGCTTHEYGKYKNLQTDGIMGMSNNPKSFISLLYNLNIINRNLFTLCFGLRGGYMSLGEIDYTFHKKDNIEYVPLLSSDLYYLVKVNSIKISSDLDITDKDKIFVNTLKSPLIARIDTGNTISYFPSRIFKGITNQFKIYCEKIGNKCGNFSYDEELGYCASFKERFLLFGIIHQFWPNITIHFGESEYTWTPINYYYYYLNSEKMERKACLGFNYHNSSEIILGANFIHGHDIIFDRAHLKLGFVPSDCSRKNLILNKYYEIMGRKKPFFETTDPVRMDQELHHGETDSVFNLGDIGKKDDLVDFIQGHNTELDKEEFNSINYIILISSMIFVVVIITIVISVLLCSRNKLTYEEQQEAQQGNVYVSEGQNNEINIVEEDNVNDINNNKISFEENNNTPEVNLEDDK